MADTNKQKTTDSKEIAGNSKAPLPNYVDFLIGFFGTLVCVGIIGSIIFSSLLGISGIPFPSYVSVLVVFLLFFIGAIIYFFKIGRKFIAIGIISALVIPLLIFGACVAILTTMF
jgi:hypothetical protein